MGGFTRRCLRRPIRLLAGVQPRRWRVGGGWRAPPSGPRAHPGSSNSPCSARGPWSPRACSEDPFPHEPRTQHRRDRASDARALIATELADQLEQLADDSTDVANEAVTSVESVRVLHALGTLPPLQRRTLVLVYFGGYTHRELAELLDWPLGTVKKRVRLGLPKLAVELGHLGAESLAAAEEAVDEL